MRLLKIIFLAVLVAAGCGKNPSSSSDAKPTVLVSIGPYKSLAERIVGDEFIVRPVVPLKANPHSFEPTAKQIQEISKGDVWFRIGEPFEEKIMTVLMGRNSSLVIYDLRDEIPLLEEAENSCKHCSVDHFDRHIWLSPKLALIQSEAMAKVLSEKYPDKKDFFEKNLKELRADLVGLDAEIIRVLGDREDRTILVSHPAFGYFCRDYHIVQLSVEFEGKDPRPKHLEALLKTASSGHAEFAIALPQHNNKGAQLIAEKLHIPVRWIDPYTTDYFEMMLTLANIIANPQYQP